MEKTPQELYRENQQRFEDVVALRTPDRVPYHPFMMFYPARFSGFTCAEVMHDLDKLDASWKKAVLDVQPDMFNHPYPSTPLGHLMSLLGAKAFEWPGGSLPVDRPYQFVEKEYMKESEYDDFLFDPTDFNLRVFLPRNYEALAPLQQMPYLPASYYTRFLTATAPFGAPDVETALETLIKAGKEAARITSRAAAFTKMMADLGIPPQSGGMANAPFDYLGDLYRGTRGIMMDIYRVPDKLLAALDKILPIVLRGAVAGCKASGIPVVFIPLHKGNDKFMSMDHFKKFYWPTLRKLIVGLIDEGLIPNVFWESECDSRMEIAADIPKGKAIYYFEGTDLFKAKDILKDTVCIRGNVPASMLCVGSVQDVKDYCKKLIDVVGKDGGLLVDGSIGVPDEAKPENVKAMSDFVREYGVYR